MPNYRIVNHKIEVEDPNDGTFHPYCEEIFVTTVIVDLLSQRQQVEILLYADPDPVTIRLPKKNLNRNILPVLIDYGLSVLDNPDQAAFILEVLWDSEASAPRVYEHNRLGFQKVGGEQVFLAHHPIGVANPRKAQSEYYEPDKVKPVGTLADWKQLVHAEAIGHENLELALALSVTAPVAHLLREARVISLIPLWALIGKSSTGKTTAMKLMASVWGSPEESSGLITDLNATQNAFFAQLSDLAGLPALIDEASNAPEWDFGKIIYNLPKGRDKQRCDNEGRVKAPVHFSGAVVLTGEQSLFDQTNGNAGLSARLVEFSLLWTVDEHHAQRLEQGCRCNYGTAVYPLMDWMLQQKASLPEIWQEQCTSMRQMVPIVSGVEDRLLKMYAIILTAAIVIRRALKLPIRIGRMKELLSDIHRSNPRLKNDPDIVFEKIKLQVLANYAHFPPPNPTASTKAVWGEQSTHKGREALWISVSKLEEFLSNAGVTEFDSMRYTFYERGWMARTADRHYKMMHSLGGIRVECYCLFPGFDHHTTPTSKSKNRSYLLGQNDTDE